VKALTLFFSLLASASSLLAQVDVLAGPITNQANGHIYYLLSPSDWYSSQGAARRLGGHLVTLLDADEDAWIHSTFGLMDSLSRNLWLGLTDEGHEGVWTWITGESFLYTNWAAGEPNNYFGAGTENYGLMYSSGQWNDATSIATLVAPPLPNGVVEVELPANFGALTIRVSELELKWPSVSNQMYQVQYRSDVTTNTWMDLFGTNVVGDGTTIRFTEKVREGTPSRFYRVLPLTNSISQ
jgi:hypothetical protein